MVVELVMGVVRLWFCWGLAVGSGVAALLVRILEFQLPGKEQ